MGSPSSTPRWTRLEHDERREQILACARRLFRDRHYSAVSTTEIAAEAGVARGLLHHYFGTKRDLYAEVVRTMVRLPPPLPGDDVRQRPIPDILDATIHGWLTMVSRNRETWFAAVGAEGLGPDPEIERILEEAREGIVDRWIEILAARHPDAPHDVVAPARAAIRSHIALAESATREWLVRGRLSREQTHTLIVRTMLALLEDVIPAIATPLTDPEGA
ncbi:TetR family transcriptional regulator [Conexibacter sp. W3-3-2]|uniref:TetR/AcrR family transcriptional regulator n=1 Tax=Conexibacter sp. W3-3-2 TaxID=2675227 RepID=UPI0012B767C2|nr:TetR/AcrR family transcriptional regulator [Conexibacter sp. W3-3-2]MTD44573.1 TetR family transcriptional regulator [Conexibacter sp. W3-3-2]